MKITTSKAVIDVILGAIAITSGARTLETYLKDMSDRGQEPERLVEVKAALAPYEQGLADKEIKIVRRIPEGAPIQYPGAQLADIAAYRNNLLKYMATNPPEITEDYKCSLTKEIFVDPVMIADGHTYERSAIEDWFKTHDTSPATALKVDHKKLTPNNPVKKHIAELY